MFNLVLENKNGKRLTFGLESPFTVTEIQGLNPAPATLNMNEVALMDGVKFSSSKLKMRTINVAFAIEYETAKNRIEVYKVLKPKQPIRLYYKGQYRDVFIDGYVESIDITYFELVQIVTVAIQCPSPYLIGVDEASMVLNQIVSDFHAPFSSTESPQLVLSHVSSAVNFSIENDGDVDCGMVIEFFANASVTNPKLINYETLQFIGVDYSLQTDDLVTIDTRQGHKTATLTRNGVTTNIFNYISEGSKWLQLPADGAVFVYSVGSGSYSDLSVTVRHNNLYEGV